MDSKIFAYLQAWFFRKTNNNPNLGMFVHRFGQGCSLIVIPYEMSPDGYWDVIPRSMFGLITS